MEDSFRVRVDRAFGSLSSSSSHTLSPSLWCLTDEEIENHAPNRDASGPIDGDDPLPLDVGSFLVKRGRDYHKEFEDDLVELDDDGGEGSSRGWEMASSNTANEVGDEEEDIRNSIGMDCTIDYEEEEDEYDKVADGREKAGECLFLRDITDYGSHINSYDELPNTFKEATRDPRANHLAAKLRLKEDAEAAGSFSALRVSDDSQNTTGDDCSNLKSILKRKENQTNSKPEKRVRFDTGCNNSDNEESNAKNTVFHEPSSELEKSASVPDYIRNPSRYTHYTFDDSSRDMDEASNQQVYMDLLSILKKSKHSDSAEVPADLSKPVIFNPIKKAEEVSVANTSNGTQKKKSLSVSALAVNSQEDEVSEMEVDDATRFEEMRRSAKRTSHQY